MTRFLSITLLAAALTASSAAFSQSLDLGSRAALHRARVQATAPEGMRRAPAAAPRHTALVRLAPGYSAADLAGEGFDAIELRHGFAVVTCSTDSADILAAHAGVHRCEFDRSRSVKLDLARTAVGIDQLHSGIDLPSSFTGRGVVTAIVDGGFDPNHINFKNAEGETRFKYYSTVEATGVGSNIRVIQYDPTQLSNYTTDDPSQTHGTHTLGIMAGSFAGEALVGTYDHSTKVPTVSTRPNPYYGVAPESTIYASTGASYDALIAYAVDGMMQARYEQDHYAPAVINLSLGGNNGSHDGKGLLCQFLDEISAMDGAVICVSSGNEGDRPIALSHTFTEEAPEVATFIRPYVYTDLRYGLVEIYSDTEESLEVSVIIYNKARKRVARTFPLTLTNGIQYICSDDSYKQDESDIVDATFAKAYKGYVGVGSMIDQDSGRFYAAVDYYVVNSDDNPADPTTTEAQYTLGFVIKGKPGQRVNCYCDGTFTALDSYGFAGYVDGSRNGSISDIATAKSVIAVGAYNTREWASNLEGNLLGYDGYFRLNDVTEFSSYGTTVDGRNLPHLLAPGCTVVSSVSTPYFKYPSNNVTEQIMVAKYNDGTRDHYFSPMMGTSMASPVVAGVVALMLEADPTLTPEEVRDILVRTATTEGLNLDVEDAVQYGAGRIDAYEAIKEVLRCSSIVTPAVEASQVRPLGNGRFEIFVPGESEVNATVFSLDGRTVASANARGDLLVADFSSLTPGIYVVCVNTLISTKIVI